MTEDRSDIISSIDMEFTKEQYKVLEDAQAATFESTFK